MFEITIDVVIMVGRTSTQSANVKVLRFSKNLRWSQFAYFELRKTRSGFSIPFDFEIAKVPCIQILKTGSATLIFFSGKEENHTGFLPSYSGKGII